MKKRFAIFFMLIHLFMVWEQEAIAVENISIESINLCQVYIRIKEGCTELSKSDLLEMDQYEEAIIYVPDSFSQIDVLYNRLNATDFDVSATHPQLSSYDGCLYSKDGKTFLLQPFGQTVDILKIKEGVINLATNSLQGKVKRLIIPSTLISGDDEIERNGSFAEIQEIDVHDQNVRYASKDGVLYSKDMKKLLCYPSASGKSIFKIPSGVEYIGSFAFASEESLEYVIIPETVSVIDDYAFWFTKLCRVEGCDGVISVGQGAFEGSVLLEEIQGMEKLESIGEEAFSATALTSFTVSQACSSIPSKAFYDCRCLKDVVILSMNTTIEEDAFSKSEARLSDAELTIHCFSNSFAESFARSQKWKVNLFNQY